MASEELRLLVFPETGGHWTARALEHDIAVQARSCDNAVDALIKIIRAHVEFDVRHNRAPLSGFSPAPRVYWSAFRFASRIAPVREVDIHAADWLRRLVVAVADQSPTMYRLSLTA